MNAPVGRPRQHRTATLDPSAGDVTRSRARGIALAAVLAAAIALVSGCQSSDGGPPPSVTAVVVAPAEVTLQPGASIRLVADVSAAGGADTAVDWWSDRPAVASIAPDGTVTAHTVGEAIVAANSRFDDARSGHATVIVTAAVDDDDHDDGAGDGDDDVPHVDPLVVAFTASATAGPAPLHVTLDASSTDLGGRSDATYAWDFGDGATAEGVTVTHTFGGAGRFTVRLTVETADDTSEADLTVTAEGAIALSPLPHVRSFHGALLLADDSVLLAGGSNGSVGRTATTVRFDPAALSFAPSGSMANDRSNPAMVLMPDGRALVAGGGSAALEAYDPATGTFSSLGSFNDLRLAVHGFLQHDGSVLFFTNASPCFAQAFVVRYTPATGTFTRLLTVGNVSGYAVTALHGGTYLVAGGVQWYTCDAGTWRNAVSIVYPAVPSQVAMGTMSTHRGSPNAVTLSDGRVLIAGNTASPDVFDPASGVSTASAATGLVRDHGAAIRIGSVRVLLTGRADEGVLEVYDPATDAITRLGAFDAQRYAYSVTRLTNGDVLIVGGRTNTVSATSDASLWLSR